MTKKYEKPFAKNLGDIITAQGLCVGGSNPGFGESCLSGFTADTRGAQACATGTSAGSGSNACNNGTAAYGGQGGNACITGNGAIDA